MQQSKLAFHSGFGHSNAALYVVSIDTFRIDKCVCGYEWQPESKTSDSMLRYPHTCPSIVNVLSELKSDTCALRHVPCFGEQVTYVVNVKAIVDVIMAKSAITFPLL